MTGRVRATAVLILILLLPVGLLADAGADAFSTKCAYCHGKEGAGKTNFAQKATLPDLRTKEIQQRTDRELHDSIGRGVGHKQYPHAFLFRGMSEAELTSVIAFIRSLK